MYFPNDSPIPVTGKCAVTVEADGRGEVVIDLAEPLSDMTVEVLGRWKSPTDEIRGLGTRVSNKLVVQLQKVSEASSAVRWLWDGRPSPLQEICNEASSFESTRQWAEQEVTAFLENFTRE